MLYRIFTENKNLSGIKKILNRLFNGYSIFQLAGFWQGITEKSLCIEILSNNQYKHLKIRIDQAAKEIGELNKQEAILVEKINCDYFTYCLNKKCEVVWG